VPESEVAELLRETERSHAGCQIGSYPFFREGKVGANFVIRSTEQETLDRCARALTAALNEAGFQAVAGGI
jgi:molybdopterin-biosynthesis enzyme MoeA-like protein